MAVADREQIALVRRSLEAHFPGHTLADWFEQSRLARTFRIDGENGSVHWLRVSEEALCEDAFDLAAVLDDRVIDILKSGLGVRITTTGMRVDVVWPRDAA